MTTATTTATASAPASPDLAGVEDMRAELLGLCLDPRGNRPILRRRLERYYASQYQTVNKPLPSNPADERADGEGDGGQIELAALGDPERDYVNGAQLLAWESPRTRRKDYYICFDVEATCVEGGTFDYQHEIIEFPALLIDARTFDIIEEFHSYVRPTKNAILSDFCTELTGISQETIDRSPTFPEMLCCFQDFLHRHKLFYENSCAFITDGPWDIRDFIRKQCQVSEIPRPSYFNEPWVDIRTLYADFYNVDKCNIDGMLERLGLEFVGRPHSGIDDARNVATIARRLWMDGAAFQPNSSLPNWARKVRVSRKRGNRRSGPP